MPLSVVDKFMEYDQLIDQKIATSIKKLMRLLVDRIDEVVESKCRFIML